jgi:hypothetical protein
MGSDWNGSIFAFSLAFDRVSSLAFGLLGDL